MPVRVLKAEADEPETKPEEPNVKVIKPKPKEVVEAQEAQETSPPAESPPDESTPGEPKKKRKLVTYPWELGKK